jgi:hypothetical protein
MFSYIFAAVSNWLENAERGRRDAYLAESSDIFELERRIRSLEKNGFSTNL